MERIVGVGVARVNQMDEEARAFDVAKETNAEARAQVCAFDEAGKIGDDESATELGTVAPGAAVGLDGAGSGLPPRGLTPCLRVPLRFRLLRPRDHTCNSPLPPPLHHAGSGTC